MSRPPPPTVEKLQTAPHAQAQEAPGSRFDARDDTVYRRDVRAWAYARGRAHGGAAGVDGQTFEDIEAYGRDRWRDEVAADLRQRTYHPQPVRRVFIPNGEGTKQRPLGLACLKDRVAERATVLVWEPVFEADREAGAIRVSPRAERPRRREASRTAGPGRGGPAAVVDGARSGSCDAIPDAALRQSRSRRSSDRFVLKRITTWLEAAVEETDARGPQQRTTRNQDEGRGRPHGSPLSPLLSNIHRRRVVKGWKTGGHEQRLTARIVTAAEDFVSCRRGTADEALATMRRLMSPRKPTVNETKTRLCHLPEESFDFLGHTIGRCHGPGTGEADLGPRPSRNASDRCGRAISARTERRWASRQVDFQVAALTRNRTGWANDCRLGTVPKADRTVDNHARYRHRRGLKAKDKVRGPGKTRFPKGDWDEDLRRYRLQAWPGGGSCAKV